MRPSRSALAAAALLLALSIAGCSSTSSSVNTSGPAPSATADDVASAETPSKTEPTQFAACSSNTTAALAAQTGALPATEYLGLAANVPVPSCLILSGGSYVGYYLDASQMDFDELASILSTSGFNVELKELDQSVKDTYGYIAYFDYRNESGQGSVTYISAAPSLSIDGPHLLFAWFPF